MASAPTLDPRRNAWRGDLAAEALRDKVAAPRYAAGERFQTIEPSVPLRGAPDPWAGWFTEVLFGELLTVYDECEGWSWVQLAGDGYVGYLPTAALSRSVLEATHRVSAPGTWLYPTANIKACPLLHLSMNALLSVAEAGETFARLRDGRWVPTAHIAALERFAPDFVAVAEAFLGAPYVWGGKTRLGLDCSGLLQVALNAAGMTCPRDSDMQEAEVGERLPVADALPGRVRGDLVFWKAHVGIMIDAERLVHANAFHMAVAIEPLRVAAARIAATGSAITAVKRLRPLSAIAGQGPH